MGNNCVLNVKKRDGLVEPFKEEKITNAIFQAVKAVGGTNIETAQSLMQQVKVYLSHGEPAICVDVADIQDAIEKILIENGHAKTSKQFILYRAERDRAREMNSSMMRTLEKLTFTDAEDIDIKRENANIDGDSPMATMLRYGTEAAKAFNLGWLYHPESANAHCNGDIHIHDLDFSALTLTCCQIDLEKLFMNGFNTGHGFLREPKDIRTYAALTCIAIQSNQNDQHERVA